MRKAVLGNHESSSNVNLMHEVILLHRLIDSPHQVDCRSVVDQDINASKCFHNFLNTLLHALFISDVALEWKSFASSLFNFFGSGVYGAFITKYQPGSLG